MVMLPFARVEHGLPCGNEYCRLCRSKTPESGEAGLKPRRPPPADFALDPRRSLT